MHANYFSDDMKLTSYLRIYAKIVKKQHPKIRPSVFEVLHFVISMDYA